MKSENKKAAAAQEHPKKALSALFLNTRTETTNKHLLSYPFIHHFLMTPKSFVPGQSVMFMSTVMASHHATSLTTCSSSGKTFTNRDMGNHWRAEWL